MNPEPNQLFRRDGELRRVVDVGHAEVCFELEDGSVHRLPYPEWDAWVKGGAYDVCPSCKADIDPDVCGCGIDLDHHRWEEHPFVSLGCDCYRDTSNLPR